MNKRGNLFDALSIISFVFMVGMVSLVVVYIMDEVNNDVQSDPDFTANAKTLYGNMRVQLPGMYDWWFALFLIGLPLLSASLAYFNNVHPILYWIALPIIFIGIFLGAAYAEVWNAAIADESLAPYANELPITNLVLTNYGKYSLLIVLIIALGTFVKLRGRGDVIGTF